MLNQSRSQLNRRSKSLNLRSRCLNHLIYDLRSEPYLEKRIQESSLIDDQVIQRQLLQNGLTPLSDYDFIITSKCEQTTYKKQDDLQHSSVS